MSLIRRQSAQHKVYLPASARENQYMLARFTVTDELVEKFADKIDHNSDQPYQAFYQTLADIFFDITHELDIENGQFVANDKFVRVRFCEEELTPQTKQQILFLYNPRYHHTEKAHFNATRLAKKFRLIFLANGDQVRLDAAQFHQKVAQAISMFADKVGVDKTRVQVCDHQHLTFDLFAQYKGFPCSQTHKFRSLPQRYAADNFTLPDRIEPLTYAVVDMPFNRRIKKLVAVDSSSNAPYEGLYQVIGSTLQEEAKQQGLTKVAVVANGLVPIMRYASDELIKEDGELLRFSFDPANNDDNYSTNWDGSKLASKIQFVFVATDADKTKFGYGKFFNQIDAALRAMANRLDYDFDKEELKVRFHQHLGYRLEA